MNHLLGKKVKIYRNLNNGRFSVKTDKVEGYADCLELESVVFTGSHSKAQAKIQSGEHRSVHAYAVGILKSVNKPVSKGLEVTYRPKERSGFYVVTTGKEITEAKAVRFTDNKMYL